MLDSSNFSDLPTFIGCCVSKLKESHPRLSALALAKKLDIPNSTFDRISKKEVKAPSFNHALKIVQEVCGDQSVQDFIRKFYPNMMADFRRVYPGNTEVPFVDSNAEVFFQSPASFEIMMMATSRAGITEAQTLEEFGKKGLSILKELLEKGILKKEGEKIYIDGTINARQETVHKLFQNLIGLSYDPSHFGDNKDWLSIQYDSVNFNVVAPQIREVYIKANQKIRELLKAPESKGDEVIWAGLAMDRLTKSKVSNDNSKGPLQ